MQRTVFNPDSVFDSLRYGFSQAVATAGGRTIHVSGQVGWDRSQQLMGEDLSSQLAAALHNLAAVLEAAGGGLGDVAALRIYVVEAAAGDLAPVGRTLRDVFPDAPPAATWLVVRRLADPAFLVEVEATAVVP